MKLSPAVAVAVAVAVFASGSAVRGDEFDDDLAKRFAGIVLDPTQSRAARVAAAKSLGALGPRASAAAPSLVVQLDRLRGTELEPLQIAVIDALGEIGPATRAVLPSVARCTGRSPDIDQAIKRATAAVFAAGDSPDRSIVRGQLTSRDASVRLRAVKAIGANPSASAGADLRPALTDTDGDVRRTAQSVLTRVAPDSVPPGELAASYALDLTDADTVVRLTALKRLGRLGQQAVGQAPAVEALLAGDPDRDVRRAAADALAAFAGP